MRARRLDTCLQLTTFLGCGVPICSGSPSSQTIPEIDCSSSRLWPVRVAQAHMATQRNATTRNSLYQVARVSGVSLVAPRPGDQEEGGIRSHGWFS